MTLAEIKRRLWKEAIEKHGEGIHLCANHHDIDECIIIWEGEYSFWFNTIDNSTHMVRIRPEGEK